MKVSTFFTKEKKTVLNYTEGVSHHYLFHHYLLFALFTQYKNLFTAFIARGRGDPGSHRAYARAASLTLINEIKKKCWECAARPIQ